MRCLAVVVVVMFLICNFTCDEGFGEIASLLVQTDAGFHEEQPDAHTVSTLDTLQTLIASADSSTLQTTDANINNNVVSYNESYIRETLQPFKGDISNQEATWASSVDDSAFINNNDINGSNLDLHTEGFTDMNHDMHRFTFNRFLGAEEYMDLITSGHFQKRNIHFHNFKLDASSADNVTNFVNVDEDDDDDNDTTTTLPVRYINTTTFENKYERVEDNEIVDTADIMTDIQTGEIQHTKTQSDKAFNTVEEHTISPIENNEKTTEFSVHTEMVLVDGNRSENNISNSSQQRIRGYFSTKRTSTLNADLVLRTTPNGVKNDENLPAKMLSHAMTRKLEDKQKHTARWNRVKKNGQGRKGRKGGQRSRKRASVRNRNRN